LNKVPKNRLDLAGKVIILTGANGILGRGYLDNYLSAGAKVAALDKNIDGLKSFQRRGGRRLLAQAVDLASPDAVRRSFDGILRRFGGLDAIHHNCGGKPDGFFDSTEAYRLDAWRGVFSANVETSLLLTQCAIPYFKRRRRGSMLFTASIYGVVGADQRIYEGSSYEGHPISNPAAYSAAKGAILSLVRHLAAELGAWGIRVNALTPGGVSSGQNGVFQKKYSARVPLGRMARGEEMIGPAMFLLSDAASYVTGHNLVVDGGLTVW
jgi:NAD(P)-dependent dehydrogenase (short-subunit alcohol dehydrogenase family)